MSYLAMRVTRMPFTNMNELHTSDYKLTTAPGSAYWDAFKYGDDLWQRIYRDKLQPFEEYNNIHAGILSHHIDWILLDFKNAAYRNYYEIS